MSVNITRRHLLKAGISAGAALTATGLLDMKNWAEAAAYQPVDQIPSLCNGCSSHCGLIVHVKGNRVWKVSGHPNHNRSKGKLCARAHAAATMPYDPDRLTQPMKRVGDTFEPIAYEKALDEIAAKLQEILKVYGPQAVFWSHNPRETFYAQRFMHAMGAPTIMTHNAACNTATTAGWASVWGTQPSGDLSNAKFILLIGRNPAEGIRTAHANSLASAIGKGAKVVTVDPRQSVSAALGTEWLAIRPGTDLALLLAMANVMVSEKLYDADFVEKYTTGFDKWAPVLAEYTPEWAAAITDIPANTITRIAREMAAAKPAALIEPGWKGAFGANYNNSTETTRAVAMVNALLGNLGKAGGLNFTNSVALGELDSKQHPAPPKPTVARADGAGVKGEFPLAPSAGVPHYLMEKAKAGKVKAGFVRYHNPVRCFPDPNHMIEGMKALDLLVVFDTHMSETALQAHYVLPEPTWLEREEIVEVIPGSKASVGMRAKAIPKLYPETHTLEESVKGLAERMGLGKYFNFSPEYVNAVRVQALGMTLPQMAVKGSITVDPPAGDGTIKIGTPSGKIQFADPKFEAAGFSAVVKWVAPSVAPDAADPMQFRLISGKQGYHTHNTTANIPHLLAISKENNGERIWINSRRAAALGIKDGDMVTVSNKMATRYVQAFVTERIHPDAVYLPLAYGGFAPFKTLSKGYGVNVNDLTPYAKEPWVGHAMMMEVVVEIQKV